MTPEDGLMPPRERTEGPTLDQSRWLGGRHALRLVLALAVIIYLGYRAHVLGTLVVVGAIVAMIMVHELGHFVTAKLSKMRVTEYFLGFGPRIWSFRRGETEYGVKALPLGGYVKISGMSSVEEVDPSEEPRTYRQASFPRRLAVGVAGSFMHFVMAFFMILAILIFIGYANPSVVEVGAVAKFQGGTSPASVAGLKAGDIIEKVNGKPVHSADVLANAIGPNVGHRVTLTIQRGSRIMSKTVVPVDGKKVKMDGHSYLPSSVKSRGVIGVALAAGTTKESFFPALGTAVTDLGRFTGGTITALAGHFSPHGISTYVGQLAHPSSNPASPGAQSRFASPVGIVRLASQAAASGVESVLGLLISINVFVGVFNMVPLLPLDGGHVVVAIYERLRSRKGRVYRVDVMKLMPLTYAVIGVLVLLSVTALYLDITHPISNPFG